MSVFRCLASQSPGTSTYAQSRNRCSESPDSIAEIVPQPRETAKPLARSYDETRGRNSQPSRTMSFRSVFVAITISGGLLLAALLINHARPPSDTSQPLPELVRATGRCAQCHREETPAVVHQFERSEHSRANITCYDCHQPGDGQESYDHFNFRLAREVTSLNCRGCHRTEYEQFARSRHALPAWAAVSGSSGMSPEHVAFGERHHPGAVDRPPNPLARREGAAATETGCLGCHAIGRPNRDGSIGSCTECHSRHSTSIALAREPRTCGQCHMGPDHAQVEIYTESKHGALYEAQRSSLNMSAEPKRLTTADMPIPTCATCHLSGLDGLRVTHDTTERLSYWLFAPVSERRPGYSRAQAEMQDTCLRCHASSNVEHFYQEAEAVLAATNEYVREGRALIADLRNEGLLTPDPFDEPIEFLYFDFWHYFGRTAKHGAFMGGADFVQWHGNYELLLSLTELKGMAAELRDSRADH